MATPERPIEVRHLSPKGDRLVRAGAIHLAIVGGEVTPIAGVRIKNLNTGEIREPLTSGIKA